MEQRLSELVLRAPMRARVLSSLCWHALWRETHRPEC